MLMMSPPHMRYILLSARVENCGPSMHTMHLPLCMRGAYPRAARSSSAAPLSTASTRPSSQRTRRSANGSPNAACATTLVPSKKLAGRTPLVRSMICVGRTKSPGASSSWSEPTAENASMARTPSDLSAAMLACAGTAEGAIVCPTPWRARKAILVPKGRAQIAIGELGKPQG